jgi:hypothetical protein
MPRAGTPALDRTRSRSPGQRGAQYTGCMRNLAFATALALAACSSDPPTLSVTASPTTLRSGEKTTLSIAVENFELVDPARHAALRVAHEGDPHAAPELTASSGHYHVYLDTTEENPIYQGFVDAPEVTVTASAGPHLLIVRLSAEDHRTLVPEIKAEVGITITE